MKGFRGPGGGYILHKPAHAISVAELISATDEWVEMSHARRISKPHAHNQERSTRDMWDDLSEQLFQFLDGITLADLIEKEHRQPWKRKLAA